VDLQLKLQTHGGSEFMYYTVYTHLHYNSCSFLPSS